MVMDLALTPTQKRLMEILKDGQPHPVAQLMVAIDDELAGGNALPMAISYLRTRIETGGMTVVAVRIGDKSGYRLARFLGDDDE